MRRLRRFLIRLAASATGRRDDERLREELEDHIAFETAEHVRAGMSAAEARRQAVLAVGPVEAIKEDFRDERRLPSLEHFLQDVRIALRRMKQAPGFTAAAVATLALGLGLNSAVLSLAYAIFLKPLPVDDASRVVNVGRMFSGDPRRGFPVSYPDYLYYRDHARTFTHLAAHYSTSPMSIITPGGPFNVMGSVVTANYFGLLRLQPAMGRFFLPEEDAVPGRNPVVVLSYDLWRTQFGADGGILGTSLRINGTAFTVVGIAPEGFHGVLMGLEPNGVWIPSAMFAVGYRYCNGLARGCNVLGLLGRLNDGVSIQDAQAEMNVLTGQLQSMFPVTDNRGWGIELRPARGIRIDEQQRDAPIVRLLAGAAALVLIIASANVAGLMLARGLRRRKEIAIRLALGAGRGRVIRLLLVESVLLAVVGGGAGFLVSVWATGVLRGYFGQAGVANTLDLSLDLRVLLAGIAVATLTGVVTGISPALQSTRPDTMGAMKEESAGAGARRSKLREGLLVLQVALSVVLLGSSGLLVRSFFLLHRGPGFDPDAIALVRLRPSLVGYTDARAWAFQREVIRRLEALPGIAAASPAVVAPLPRWGRPVRAVRLAGDSGNPSDEFRTATTFVGPRYFKTLGTGLIVGREFDDHDTEDGPRVAMVNEALARRLWPKGDVVGSHVTIGPGRYEIVGLVKDLQWLSAFEAPEPIAYLNYWQQDRSNSWSQDSRTHIRVSGAAAAAMVPEIRRVITEIDPDVPVSEVQVLGRQLDVQFAAVRGAGTMFLVFGGLALVLSAIGLYAALAFAIGQRTREIAVRMALGASRLDVGRLVFRRGSGIFAIGAVTGLAACLFAGPLLAHLLYGVSPRDPVALLTGPLVLGLVAVLAIWLPARRAMRLDPVAALRAE
jgi:putative ABC transport system permease protein